MKASRLLSPLLTPGSVGLKALAFSGKGPAPPKHVYAIVCQTIKHKPLLDAVLKQVAQEHNKGRPILAGLRDPALGYVLLYELLLGPEKKIKGGGAGARAVKKFEAPLREAVASHGPVAEHVPTAHWPSYVRVNTLLCSLADAAADAKARYGADKVALHPVVDDLLVLHPECAKTLFQWERVKEGGCVIQDLSSCLTAVALAGGAGDRWWAPAPETPRKKKGKKKASPDPAPGAPAANPAPQFLDACAAPGNKTSHLAAIVNAPGAPRNLVLGLDRAEARVKILRKRTALLAPGGEVEALHADYLNADPADEMYKDLKGILLDPSCSGSGIVSQPDRVTDAEEEKDEAQRLAHLSSFQLLALLHAMSFPQVARVAYSTCSVNDEENEAVVGKALEEANGKIEAEGERWELVRPRSLDGWARRGRAVGGLTEEQAGCLCRCDPFEGDETKDRKSVV